MTVTSEGGSTNLQNNRAQLGRTFAMTVVSWGYAGLTAGFAYLTFLFAQASDDPQAADLVWVPLSFTAVVAAVGTASALWTGARRRAWFWLVVALIGLIVLVTNASHIAYDITRPANTQPFLLAVVVLVGSLFILFGGIASFIEVRRGQPAWSRSGPAGSLSIIVVAVLIGSVATSLLAGRTSGSGGGVAEAPTLTGVLTAEKTSFVETSLRMENGEILGLFVINKDSTAHSFDIDSLDIHVPLPANSTTAVTIRPTAPGNLEFFCAVPGHREAGMVGRIEVEA